MPHINGLYRESSFAVVGFPREITLIDNDLTQDSSKYVACISIPIE
ncbi:hypothetical protein [Bifidobacterium pseudocatenulatum]|nr:hypothetical protein [Bifidobacterium pseudocatenulatum]MCB4910546.1 hypothetical protein [Bifidobacterium pseudocatenulatum]